MNRRALLLGSSAVGLTASRAFAQPMPLIGPVGGRQPGGGPLWSFSRGPPGATLDLSFMTPGTLPTGVTFTRASTATYFDSTGTIQTAAINAPRWDYDPVSHALKGLLIEPAATNLLLNSATLGTQSVTVIASPYTLSFYGTGTITLSGVSTAGPLVGTGAFPTRVSLLFTPTAGTLTLTVTGSVLNAQLENTSFATSYIPTTSTSINRSLDACNASSSPWYSAVASTLFVNSMVPYAAPSSVSTPVAAQIDDGTNNNIYAFRFVPPNLVEARVLVASATTGFGQFTYTANALMKLAATFNTSPFGGSITLNGGTPQTFALTSVPSGISRLNVGAGRLSQLGGWISRITYWPRILTNAELQSVTT